jgi:hypothetical protein
VNFSHIPKFEILGRDTMPSAAPLEVIIVKEEVPVELVPEQETHDVILADAERDPSQPHLYNMILRDYEESLSKCKPVRQHQSSSSSRPCEGTPSAEPMFHPAQSQFQLGPQSA